MSDFFIGNDFAFESEKGRCKQGKTKGAYELCIKMRFSISMSY